MTHSAPKMFDMFQAKAKNLDLLLSILRKELLSSCHRYLCNPFTLDIHFVVMLDYGISVRRIEKAETYAGFLIVK